MESLIKIMPQKVEAALAYGLSMSNMENRDYKELKRDLQNLFLVNFNKHVEVHIFGSRLIGIAHVGSDADIFVDVGK